jgi:hypothetical protein
VGRGPALLVRWLRLQVSDKPRAADSSIIIIRIQEHVVYCNGLQICERLSNRLGDRDVRVIRSEKSGGIFVLCSEILGTHLRVVRIFASVAILAGTIFTKLFAR